MIKHFIGKLEAEQSVTLANDETSGERGKSEKARHGQISVCGGNGKIFHNVGYRLLVKY